MTWPLTPVVHVSDSSDRGYALLYRKASFRDIEREMRHRERWRFQAVEQPPQQTLYAGCFVVDKVKLAGDGEDDVEDAAIYANSEVRGTTVGRSAGADTEYGRWLASARKLAGAPKFDHHVRKKGSEVLIPYAIPEVAEMWGPSPAWQVASRGRWRWPKEHINVKEARAALSGVRRLSRSSQT